MSNYFSVLASFLSHGGFKLLIIGFFLVMQFARSRAKKAQENEAKLRGDTGISDFSAPAAPASPMPKPNTPPTFSPPEPAPTFKKAPPASPWANDQNPFSNKKS